MTTKKMTTKSSTTAAPSRGRAKVGKPLCPADEMHFREFINIPREHEVISINHQTVLDLFALLDATRSALKDSLLKGFAHDESDEVSRFLATLAREDFRETFKAIGRFACKKKLSDGSTIAFSISEPDFNKRRKR